MPGFRTLAPLLAQAADNKKAEDILLLDVRKSSGITDFLILASINSPAHLDAVQAEIEKVMDSAGVSLCHRDGSQSLLWRVLDYGGVMVHLMHNQARVFYQIEKLYRDSFHLNWHPKPAGRDGMVSSPARRRRSASRAPGK